MTYGTSSGVSSFGSGNALRRSRGNGSCRANLGNLCAEQEIHVFANDDDRIRPIIWQVARNLCSTLGGFANMSARQHRLSYQV